MANEFVARNGVIAQNNSVVSGSLVVTNGITGSLFGTSSQALTASYIAASGVVGLNLSLISTGSITASVSLGSGSFAVTSGSSTFLFVSSSGNVGIGTTSQSKKLSVQTTTGADAINWTDGTRNGYLYVDGAGVGIFSGVAASGQGIYMNNTSTYLELWTNSTNRVRIDSTGNVGINTTTPSASLDVSGSVRYTNGLSGTGSVNISGSLTVTGSITTNGTITAQTLVVQTITSSIEYSSGSNIFGSQLTDRQTMTGSINMTGSLNLYGNQNITGSLNVSGSLTLASASLSYQHNLSLVTGSYQVIASAATGSYRCAFFDYVMFSGSIVRGGTVTSTWSGSATEYYENYTADLGGSTSGVTLQTALSTGNIQLQASASTAAWTIRSLIRLL